MRRTRILPLAALLLCTPVLAGTAPASAAPKAAQDGPLRILLTNDDGYNAPGIRMLYQRLTDAGYDVTIVAPLTNQSGAGSRAAGLAMGFKLVESAQARAGGL